MALRDCIEANAAFIGRPAAASPGEATPLLVVTDSEPALTGLLEPALGLGRGAAVVIRLAGAWGGRSGEDWLRSVTGALALHGCNEIAVVGASRSRYCPPDRARMRTYLRTARLGGESETSRDLLASAANPAAAVLETVRLLRNSPYVPEAVTVHGCLLDVDTGRLEVIDLDRSLAPAAATRSRPTPPSADMPAAAVFEKLEMPPLPEIPLPALPELDLDALLAVAPKPKAERKKSVPYGTGIEGVGPISAAALAGAIPPPSAVTPSALAAFQEVAAHAVSVHVPPPPIIRDTGLPDPPLPAAVEAPRVETHFLEARPDVQARQSIPRAAVTPTPPPAPMAPRAERVLDFEQEDPVDGVATLEVDLNAGVMRQGGRSRAIEGELLAALRKVSRFLAAEMRSPLRAELANQLARAAARGEPAVELIKRVISPVLKMGKKRYSVINELLRLKEDLPNHRPEVVAAVLDRLLRGS